MKRAGIKRSLALLLAIVMCIGLLQTGAMAAQAEQDEITVDALETPEVQDTNLADQPDVSSENTEETKPYSVDFTDGEAHGWVVKNGGGTAEPSEDGLKLVGSGATFLTAADAPSFLNGYFEIGFQNHVDNEGRLGFLMRLEPQGEDNPSPKNTAGFYYDPNTGLTRAWSWGAWKNGTEFWGGQNASNADFVNLDKSPLVSNHDYKLYIQLVDGHIRADLTDLETDAVVTVVDEEAPANFPAAPGKIGFRFWGYKDGTGEHYARATIQNISAGELTPVSLSPAQAEVSYEEAGSEDVSVTLSTAENALVSCTVDGQPLEEGTDYDVSEDGTTLQFKKEFIGKQKENGNATVELRFADGLRLSFPITITGSPEADVDFVMDFSEAENADLDALQCAKGTMALEDGKLTLSQTSDVLVKSGSTAAVKDCEIHAVMKPLDNSDSTFGVYLRYVDANDYIFVGMPKPGAANEYGASWELRTPGKTVTLLEKGSRSLAERKAPYDVRVRVVGNTVTLFWDGIELAQADISSFTKGHSAGWCGVSTGRGAAVERLEIHNAAAAGSESIAAPDNGTIASDTMTVTLDKNFPRVVSYSLGGTTVDGQVIPYYAVEVNNAEYVPTVVSDFTGDTAVYTLTAGEYTFKTVFSVSGDVLTMTFADVPDTIYSINFPKHSLVSMKSSEAGAQLTSQTYAQTSNQVSSLSSRSASAAFSESAIVVLSSNAIAAAIYNDTIKDNRDIAIQTQALPEGGTTTGMWANEFVFRSRIDGEPFNSTLGDMLAFGEDCAPSVQVKLVKDVNNSGAVNYQDGAVAYCDLAPRPVNADVFQDTYGYISINVGSGVQYPFLRVLDNAKKFYLGTDGFAQNILLKGYQNEGHDAAHPNVADINQRAGGIEDFQTLLREARNYNASIGIHINHTESYPEAPQYSSITSDRNGWAWYDQSKYIVRENDIMDKTEGLYARLDDLKEIVGDDLNMVYVDVYTDRDYPANRLLNALNSRGWAVGGEYQPSFPKQIAWWHNPLNYANDSLIRIAGFGDREIFAATTLFRGPSNRLLGLGGWQGGFNYDNTIKDFFTNVLPNKYLMHFPIQIVESSRAVLGEQGEVVSTAEGNKNVITKDGKTIARGNQLFIPWDPETEEKIYVYSDTADALTWDLPDSWLDVTECTLYPLSDQGRGTGITVNVNNHQVTLNLAANQGYVLYKAETVPTKNTPEEMQWSSGAPVKDEGFDSYTFGYAWEKSSTAEDASHITFARNSKGNTEVQVGTAGDGTLAQTMTGLVPGQTYTASVWMNVPEGRRGTISVETGSKTVSEYAEAPVGLYALSHTDRLGMPYQRVKVTFVAESSTATLKLIAAAGDQGTVAFDDVRVVKSQAVDTKGHDYYEDFEDVDQGWGIFESYYTGSQLKFDNSHLSQRNPKTPQVTDDVINGAYSFKLCAYTGDGGKSVIRTLPHRVRLTPNSEYTLSFQFMPYLCTSPVTFSVKSDILGTTAFSAQLTGADRVAAHKEFTFITGDAEDYYLEFVQMGAASNKGYVLDDIAIDRVGSVRPSTLENVTAADITGTTANILWDVVEGSDPITRYEIYQGDTLVAAMPEGSNSALITGLTPGTSYEFSVFAYYGAIKATPVMVSFKTLGSAVVTSSGLTLKKGSLELYLANPENNDINFTAADADMAAGKTWVNYDYNGPVTIDSVDFTGWWPKEQSISKVSFQYYDGAEWKNSNQDVTLNWATPAGSGGPETIHIELNEAVKCTQFRILVKAAKHN